MGSRVIGRKIFSIRPFAGASRGGDWWECVPLSKQSIVVVVRFGRHTAVALLQRACVAMRRGGTGRAR